jgi:hypothetical protein
MNSTLLTTEGVSLFICTPIALLIIGAWHVYKNSIFAHIKYFVVAATLLVVGLTTGGETSAYRHRAQKISDKNFSLFYSDDLNYQVMTDNKRWDNIAGDILVTKSRNAWGAEIGETVSVVPSIEK